MNVNTVSQFITVSTIHQGTLIGRILNSCIYPSIYKPTLFIPIMYNDSKHRDINNCATLKSMLWQLVLIDDYMEILTEQLDLLENI